MHTFSSVIKFYIMSNFSVHAETKECYSKKKQEKKKHRNAQKIITGIYIQTPYQISINIPFCFHARHSTKEEQFFTLSIFNRMSSS